MGFPSGTEMLLKSFGLDPVAIKAQVEQAQSKAIEFGTLINGRVATIEIQLVEINSKLDLLIAHFKIGAVDVDEQIKDEMQRLPAEV